MLPLVLILAVLSSLTTAQMVQQCTCAQVEPCSHVDSNAVLQCIDQCQFSAQFAIANCSRTFATEDDRVVP
ncbi:hypothetical protein Y032_0006g3154 [Ancylostoma ceylanicum]|uniref:Uncharacterized protein n=1 Tax=Ancylostoma ceylanicum TaxID=53326 RepID=A0A016VQZ4_9BILA|nr:hypothetical protein Y032_0006g3154 [Ancylostoma ceylanicum]